VNGSGTVMALEVKFMPLSFGYELYHERFYHFTKRDATYCEIGTCLLPQKSGDARKEKVCTFSTCRQTLLVYMN
jgi:hypothetical protein